MEEFDLKKALKGIAKRHAESSSDWAEFQEQERQKLMSMLSGLTEVDLKIQHGQRAIEIARENIERLKDAGDTAALEFEFERMAEGYALQGDFKKAAEFASNPEKRVEYQAMLEAVEKNDDEVCGCPKTQNGHPTTFIKDRFYTARGVCTLYHCTLCGFQNATC